MGDKAILCSDEESTSKRMQQRGGIQVSRAQTVYSVRQKYSVDEQCYAFVQQAGTNDDWAILQHDESLIQLHCVRQVSVATTTSQPEVPRSPNQHGNEQHSLVNECFGVGIHVDTSTY